VNLGDKLQLKSDSFPIPDPLCSTDCEIQKRSVLPIEATFMATANHHHMKASQHVHRSTHQAALHPSLRVWPKCPGHAALHALESVCSFIIWSWLYTMWLLCVHLHKRIPEGPQIHMEQRCLCHSRAVVPARTRGVILEGTDQLVCQSFVENNP